MGSYRMYRLNEFGLIGYAEEIGAEDDAAAIAQVRRLWPKSRQCEIWQDRRLVATLEHNELMTG